MEANMNILEGAQYRLRVKLTSETGEALPPENFRVYGGAFCPGYAPAHFHAERTEAEWILTMPGLKPGRVPWNWQVIAAEYATGVEWLLASGEVTVKPRHATGSAAVDPGELNVLATLDKTTLKMTVQLGESTAECGLAVVAARNSAAAAADSAVEAGEHRAGAEAAQRAADVAAADAAADAVTAQHQAGEAAGSAAVAEDSAVQAAASAAGANADAELAHEHATEAAASATDAANSATDAATSSKAAADSASEAIEAKEAATQQAAGAEASATAAARSEEAAAGSAQAADASAELASEHAAEAAGCAADAQQAQQAAAASASQAASTLTAAAKKNGNNTYTGTNTFNGTVAVNGGLTLPAGPAGVGYAVSLQNARMVTMVEECLRRRLEPIFTVISGEGTCDNVTISPASGSEVVASATLDWKIGGANYGSIGKMFVPVSRTGNNTKARLRMCFLLSCNISSVAVQTATMMQPFVRFKASGVGNYWHCHVLEVEIGYDEQGQQEVTVLTPIVEDGSLVGMREQKITLGSLSTNYCGIAGLLFIRADANKYEVYAVSVIHGTHIVKCGEVWCRSILFNNNNNNTNKRCLVGACGGRWCIPGKIVIDDQCSELMYNSAEKVAIATGAPTVTDYTFEEFNAKYGITE